MECEKAEGVSESRVQADVVDGEPKAVESSVLTSWTASDWWSISKPFQTS